MIKKTTKQTLLQLRETILILTPKQYTQKLDVLSHSSIGMHVRHILEFYQCLMNSMETEIVNYDTRNRELKLESQSEFAIELIDEIIIFIESIKKDTSMLLRGGYCYQDDSQQIEVSTYLFRELIYNIEHMVHHLAIIKIGLRELDPSITTNQHMGVAASTIRNKNICAQ